MATVRKEEKQQQSRFPFQVNECDDSFLLLSFGAQYVGWPGKLRASPHNSMGQESFEMVVDLPALESSSMALKYLSLNVLCDTIPFLYSN